MTKTAGMLNEHEVKTQN